MKFNISNELWTRKISQTNQSGFISELKTVYFQLFLVAGVEQLDRTLKLERQRIQKIQDRWSDLTEVVFCYFHRDWSLN